MDSPGCSAIPARPVFALSVTLLATYKSINRAHYYERRKTHALHLASSSISNRNARCPETSSPCSGLHNRGYDDENGHYVVQLGEEIYERYIVRDVVGRGSFGVVLRVFDQKRDEEVALKIIRNRPNFLAQARVEIEVLAALSDNGADQHNVVQLLKHFHWQGHLCLVFELLSRSLYDLLRHTNFSGLSISLVKKFSYQLTNALCFLRTLPRPIVHCDVKPENILLKNPRRSAIRLIDFGSSCFLTKRIHKYIQSRFYRSPEVILGLPYDCSIDMWSAACLLIELYTGQPLFAGATELEQLHRFARLLGDVPSDLVAASPKRDHFYCAEVLQGAQCYTLRKLDKPIHDAVSLSAFEEEAATVDFHAGGTFSKERVEELIAEKLALKRPPSVPLLSEGGVSPACSHGSASTSSEHQVLTDLLSRTLQYRPSDRLSPSEWLLHPFFDDIR